MQPITKELLLDSLNQALEFSNPLTDVISTEQFSSTYPQRPAWAVGPFRQDGSLTFRQEQDWPDPTGIGWTSDSIFNPSLMERDGRLHLFYRASPRKESIASRIGMAVHDPATGWRDNAENPVIFPTRDNEVLGCEDPKVYAAGGRYYMFYNGIFTIGKDDRPSGFQPDNYPLGDVGCDINLAISDDLVHWEKHGLVVPHEVSQFWAKGAVIPRRANGEAVKIAGEYLMYLSEGCGGVTHVGRSPDLVNWTFSPQEYLDLGPWVVRCTRWRARSLTTPKPSWCWTSSTATPTATSPRPRPCTTYTSLLPKRLSTRVDPWPGEGSSSSVASGCSPKAGTPRPDPGKCISTAPNPAKSRKHRKHRSGAVNA
ncbi:glycoside hydrolase family 130 protein [Arthrobacter sp. ERGS1:01]|uniref:glycoside hydrolase family 130 protein n=1 Tax=Arthrobacter sp. ERGS1:01 TaxID=1704044 RepID=UPI000B0EA684|nr:hypothetical protein [Arthrobacter sp. ERGS1:01]